MRGVRRGELPVVIISSGEDGSGEGMPSPLSRTMSDLEFESPLLVENIQSTQTLCPRQHTTRNQQIQATGGLCNGLQAFSTLFVGAYVVET